MREWQGDLGGHETRPEERKGTRGVGICAPASLSRAGVSQVLAGSGGSQLTEQPLRHADTNVSRVLDVLRRRPRLLLERRVGDGELASARSGEGVARRDAETGTLSAAVLSSRFGAGDEGDPEIGEQVGKVGSTCHDAARGTRGVTSLERDPLSSRRDSVQAGKPEASDTTVAAKPGGLRPSMFRQNDRCRLEIPGRPASSPFSEIVGGLITDF